MELAIGILGVLSTLVGFYVWKQKQKKRTTAGDIIKAVEDKRRARDSLARGGGRSSDTANRVSNINLLLKARRNDSPK